MYRVYSLRLGPHFVVGLVAENNFYLGLKVEKMRAFAVFKNNYLRSHCRNRNFTSTVNLTNPKTEILSEIIEI